MRQAHGELGHEIYDERTLARAGAVGWQKVRAQVANAWWWIGMASTFVVVISSIVLTTHFLSRDEGAYLAIARGILAGHVPYRDYLDQPGPAIYYVLAAVLAVVSWLNPIHQVQAVLVFVDLVNLSTAVGIVLLGTRLWRREVGVLAAALWLVVLPFYQGNYIVLEPFATACCVWSALAATWTISSQRPLVRQMVRLLRPLGAPALLAGVILSLAAMFRQTAILELPGIMALLWARASSWRERGRIALLLAVGFCLPWLLVCAGFALGGSLGPLLNDVVWVNLVHYPGDSLSAALRYAELRLGFAPLVWLVPIGALLPIVVQSMVRQRPPNGGVVACYLLALLGLVPVLSHHWTHYWLQALPWASLLTALSIGWLGQNGLELLGRRTSALASHLSRHTVAIATLLVALFALYGASSLVTQQRVDASQVATQVSEVAWLRANVPATATLLVGPAEPELYVLSGRVPRASYVYLLPVDSSLFAQAATDIQAGRYQYIAWATYGERYVEYAQIDAQIHLHYHVISVFTGAAGVTGSDCNLYELNAPSP
jgi:hypothetical protein